MLYREGNPEPRVLSLFDQLLVALETTKGVHLIFRCEIGEKKKTVVFDAYAYAYDGEVPIGR